MSAPTKPSREVAEQLKLRSATRRRIQLVLWPVVVITIVGGLKYPLLGFIVPVVMLTGIVGSFLNGRWVCGHICPRGAFFDRIMKSVSPRRPIPQFLRSPWFRWPMLTLLMGFMTYQIAQNPGDLTHWGRVFVRICIITTGIGVALALAIHPRSWCTFCPMGTMQRAIGGKKSPLRLAEGCKGCRTCEKACPVNLTIITDQQPGVIELKDCLKCPECQLACPRKVLSF